MESSVNIKESLWEVAFSQLPEDQQKALKTGLILPLRFQDLTIAIEKAREHAASKWKITTRHGEIDVRAKFSKIVSWLQRFVDVGDVVVNYDPGHAALPWAAVRLVLQVMVNSTTRATKFVEGVEQVAFYIYDSTVRENLYLTMEPYEDSNDLRTHILTLYVNVLRFLLKARLFFEASSTKRMLSSITKSADDVMQLLGPVAQQASQIVTISGRIDAKTQISTSISMLSLSDSHAKSMEWLRHQVRTNDTVMSSLITSMASNHYETMSRFEKLENSYNKHDRLEILSWLSAIPYHQHHRKAYSEVLEGTGSWFLEDSEYMRWRGCDKSAMLWIHGIAGSGKSKLVSLAIQKALEGNGESLKPLYFYCSRSAAEPERARAEDIMRSLVKQLSTYGVSYDASAIPDYVVERYRTVEDQGFASGGLSFEDSCDFISKFAADHRRLLIIVDGLDECNEDARHLLIQGFNDIIRKSSTAVVRLLISSRDSPYLSTYFEEHQTYEVHVESNRNQQDIDIYVDKQLGQLIVQKRLRLDEGKAPSAKLQQLIVARLCDEAQGMFRWVSLQLDYICTLRKASDIRKRLGKLPNSLSNSYQELYDRKFEEYEPEERKRLEIALSLLLVSWRPADPRVFSKFVFWDNDGDEEDEEEGEDEDEEEEDDEGDGGDKDSVYGSDEDEETEIGNNSDSEVELAHLEDNKEAEHIQTLDDSDPRKDFYQQQGSRRYEDMTRLCFDLVVFDTAARVFRFAHTSVQDYLVNHNPTYQSHSDSHARLAKRCISILLHTIQSRRYHFENFPIDENQIQVWENEGGFPKAIEDVEKCKMEGNLGKRPASSLMNLKVPTYTKAHRNRLDPVTLEVYMLPWKWDKRDPNFILIMCWVPGYDLDILFDHTRQVRARRMMEPGEALSETAVVPKQDHADSETAARTRRDRSRLPYRSSGGRCLQVHDFWYFDSPPPSELTSFVDDAWAFFTSNSGEVRCTKEFRELEEELQYRFTRQSWKTVRPRVLFSACKAGLTSHVRAWTEAYPQLARTAQNSPIQTTALMEMCGIVQSQPQIAKILIDNGAETIHFHGQRSENPLCKAAGCGEEAMALLLLEKRPDLVSALGVGMSSPLTCTLNHYPANALSIVQILLNHGASANEICDNFHKYRALHLAAKRQDVGVMELLVDNGAFIDAQDAHGLTPLATVILEGGDPLVNIRCCRFLLARGADVHLIDVDGNSLFTVAVTKAEHLPIAELLCEYGADINARNKTGDSALHLAASKGQAVYAIVLVNWGIDVNATNCFGRSALHVAARRSDPEIAEMLIASGADVNVTDFFGLQALRIAVHWGNIETVKLLIRTTTDIDCMDYDGHTALSKAALNGDRAVVDLLLDTGAQIFPRGPGPDCPFLDPAERTLEYFRDPVLAALGNRHLNVAKVIMESAGGREKGSEFAEALHMLDMGDMYGFRRWSANRFRNAPENQSVMVAMRQDILARADDLIDENIRRVFAPELGISGAELGISDADSSDEYDSEDKDSTSSQEDGPSH